ncbi:uncharacterized protein LOC122002393 [Zingiber officinale]|uniref:uncharacterized protein LOC122002393 n=1 Tax=Zingiber officinale TaxID=94328 RepID=UPI001C4B1850|nr:uncharacterized protein LOC122002393 [Zingiber officinale]
MATEILISPIDQAAATPALPLQPAATAGSTRMWGWMATTARAVGGACLHVLESSATGTLIFTSVSLLLVWQQKKKTRRPARPLTRSMSIAMLQGGDKAMQRFKLCHDAIHDEAKLKAAVDDMRREIHMPQIDFAKLYACVGVVEISGKEKEAIELLEDALKRQKAEHTHEIHELELLLVEMNIYQGNYQKALNYPCMKADDISSADARVHLYQAVIYTMMNDEERARESYKKMREIRSGFHGQKFFKEGSSMSLDVADFDEFAKVAKRLVQEIQEAQSGTPAAKAQESQQKTDRSGQTDGKEIKDAHSGTTAAEAQKSQQKTDQSGKTDGQEVINAHSGKTAADAQESQQKTDQSGKTNGQEIKDAHSGKTAADAQKSQKKTDQSGKTDGQEIKDAHSGKTGADAQKSQQKTDRSGQTDGQEIKDAHSGTTAADAQKSQQKTDQSGKTDGQEIKDAHSGKTAADAQQSQQKADQLIGANGTVARGTGSATN